MTTTYFTGGTIWAGPDLTEQHGWVRVVDTHIDAIGDGAPPGDSSVVDLDGGHLVPGFVDSHTHLSVAALTSAAGPTAATSLGSLLHTIEREAATSGAPWLVITGVQPEHFDELRLPTRDELDRAAPGRNVLVCHRSLHHGVASSPALEHVMRLGLLDNTSRDVDRTRRGTPTGLLWESAFGAVLYAALEANAVERDGHQALHDEFDRHVAYGITHAHDPCLHPAVVHEVARAATTHPLRVTYGTAGPHGLLDRFSDTASELPGACEHKIFLDGGDRCAWCAPITRIGSLARGSLRLSLAHRTLEPFRRSRAALMRYTASQIISGELRYDDAALAHALESLAARSLPIRVHALGNRALQQLARVQNRVQAPDLRVDHCALADQATIDAIAQLEVPLSMQPAFLTTFGEGFEAMGLTRIFDFMPVRSFLDAGCDVALTSDHPCGVLDPLASVRAATTRRLPNGYTVDPDQQITVREALRAISLVPRATLGLPGDEGISVGGPADFAVLSGRPDDEQTIVTATWIGGQRAKTSSDST